MVTTTLYKYIQSELQKKGHDEFIDDEGNLVLFDNEHQFTTKILKFDDDVKNIVDDLFSGATLNNEETDHYFKKGFLMRFINRQINRQTIESFKMELLATFISNEDFINRLFKDIDLYVTGTSENKQKNKQVNDGTTTTDNRSAFIDQPQSSVNLDLDKTKTDYATDNTISRNKQNNKQETDGQTTGESKSYQLDELFKINGLMDQIFDVFDKRCFLQIW